MVSAFFFDGIKAKTGRSPGSGLNEPDTFLWDQANAYEENRPQGLWKLEVSQTFSPNFFVSAKAAYYNTGFGLISRNPDQSYTYDYVAGQTVGSYYDYFPVRPQKTLDADANYFVQGLGGSHELKFGFGYREVTTSTNYHWTGNQLVGYINSTTDQEAQAVPRGQPGRRGQVPEPLRGGRVHEGPALDQPRRPLGHGRRPGTPRPRPPRTRPSRTGCPGSSTRATRAIRSTGRTSRRAPA